MNKLIVVIMGPGKKHFAEMCLDSVKDADKILYWTSDKFLAHNHKSMVGHVFNNYKNLEVLYNSWDETDPATNGKCRHRYLEELKKNYNGWICLVLDEDEILSEDGVNKIKEFIKNGR